MEFLPYQQNLKLKGTCSDSVVPYKSCLFCRGRDQRQFTVVVASVLGVLGVIIIVALMSALWLSFTDYNGFAQHIPSTVRTASTTRSEDAGRVSISGTSTDVLISGSVKTT